MRPPKDYVKINWDASFDTKGCNLGVGLVARNHAGRVLATFCEK
jgi:hypothetical protein